MVVCAAMTPLRVAIIGMGGFAAAHHDAVARLEAKGEFRLIAACDPAIDTFEERQKALRFGERGTRLFKDYLAMLEACGAELDMVTIPTPIPLHAPMHRACVERGLAVYLEKPPTLDYAELERMITVDAGARHQTVVGFNFIVETERQMLKRRLVAGDFGPVRRVSARALWPRNAAYFARAGWAGRLQQDGRLILDSCIGNAMAHQVHNALFWCGVSDFWAWGGIVRLRAELYRAHAIEGLDTAFVAATTEGGIELFVGMSHACDGNGFQEECVVCDRAVIRYHINSSGPDGACYTITWSDGRTEAGHSSRGDLVDANFEAYAAYVRRQAERPLTRLVDSRPFVHLNNLAYIASRRIVTVKVPHMRPAANGHVSVAGLPEAVGEFVGSGRFPSEQGMPWAAPGGSATPADLPALDETVRTMAAARAAELLI